MIKLAINNSFSQVVGLAGAEQAELARELSSEEEAYGYAYLNLKQMPKLRARGGKVFFKDVRGIPRPVVDKRFKPFTSKAAVEAALEKREYAMARGYITRRTTLLGKRGDFPSGLLRRVEKYLKFRSHEIVDTRRRPAPPEKPLFRLMKALTPYPDQTDCVAAAAKYHRGACVMPTGTGKSITMALLMLKLQVRTLVIVPNLGLKRQLTETFLEIFGSLAHITVENIDSPRLAQLTDFDCLILDEAHHAAASTYRKLNKRAWKGIYYRFYFTATPFRSHESEAIILESVIGRVIYRLPDDVAVARKYICPIEAYYFTLPPTPVGDELTWRSVYSALVVNNDFRNAVLADLIKNLYGEKQSVLCLVKEIEHGETLRGLTGAAFAHGEADDTEQLLDWFSSGRLGAVIATTGVAGEGRDTRAAEWVIVAGGGKSRNAFVQQVGRGRRRFPGKESCKVLLFKDESHKWLLDHFNAQCAYLREEFGIEAFELPLPRPVGL